MVLKVMNIQKELVGSFEWNRYLRFKCEMSNCAFDVIIRTIHLVGIVQSFFKCIQKIAFRVFCLFYQNWTEIKESKYVLDSQIFHW